MNALASSLAASNAVAPAALGEKHPVLACAFACLASAIRVGIADPVAALAAPASVHQPVTACLAAEPHVLSFERHAEP